MSANLRVQWLHRKITEQSYPNAKRLSERFNISHRQAQRDVDFLRDKLGAPLAFDYFKKGFYYTEDFTLPVALTGTNDEDFNGVVSSSSDPIEDMEQADSTLIQLQLPYSATVKIPSKLTVVELGGYISEKLSADTYRCEFHSIEKFISVIFTLEDDISVVSPDWLRTRIVRCAERVIKNNSENN